MRGVAKVLGVFCMLLAAAMVAFGFWVATSADTANQTVYGEYELERAAAVGFLVMMVAGALVLATIGAAAFVIGQVAEHVRLPPRAQGPPPTPPQPYWTPPQPAPAPPQQPRWTPPKGQQPQPFPPPQPPQPHSPPPQQPPQPHPAPPHSPPQPQLSPARGMGPLEL